MERTPVSREHLPHACGVYIMRDASGEVLYVGKAVDLARRVAQYFAETPRDLKTNLLAPLVRRVDYIACASEREALVWERRLIGRHQPFFNVMWKDDKSYPFVRLSLEEDFPRLRVVRKKRRDGARYFGPYPKVTPVRGLLRSLWKRRLIPLRPCDWEFSREKPLDPAKINSCLYYHTGECPAPCAGRISYEDYRRQAEDARLFFEGRYSKLKASMREEMRRAAERLDFEEAARLRDNLEGIEHMAERVRYAAVRPAKEAERLSASDGVTDLQQALALPRPPHHIECFDISHLFGKQTVASMVCFMGGQPHKDHYRRFRVRTVPGIDDFASMAEVVARRARALKEGEALLPDLILIDGGKGQLSAAERALSEAALKVPLAALAKREEELFTPGLEGPLRLDRARPARRLVERVRDEAHRFAVSYHRLLRGKEMFREKSDDPA